MGKGFRGCAVNSVRPDARRCTLTEACTWPFGQDVDDVETPVNLACLTRFTARPGMNQPNAPRIATLLRQHVPLGLCGDCVAAELGLSPRQVHDAALMLVLRERGFQMIRRLCNTCRRTEDILAFDGRSEGGAFDRATQAATTAKVVCIFCRAPIAPTANQPTARDVATHACCRDRKTRAGLSGEPHRPAVAAAPPRRHIVLASEPAGGGPGGSNAPY